MRRGRRIALVKVYDFPPEPKKKTHKLAEPVPLHVNVEAKVKLRLQEIAEQENMTLSELVRTILDRYLEGGCKCQ